MNSITEEKKRKLYLKTDKTHYKPLEPINITIYNDNDVVVYIYKKWNNLQVFLQTTPPQWERRETVDPFEFSNRVTPPLEIFELQPKTFRFLTQWAGKTYTIRHTDGECPIPSGVDQQQPQGLFMLEWNSEHAFEIEHQPNGFTYLKKPVYYPIISNQFEIKA